PVFPLPSVHRWLGRARTQDRAALAGVRAADTRVGLGAEIPAGLFAEYADRIACGDRDAGQGAGHREQRPPAELRRGLEEFSCRALSPHAYRGDGVGYLVVRGDSSAERYSAGGERRAEA